MGNISPAGQLLLNRIYDELRRTRAWPAAKGLRIEMHRRHKILLEEVVAELGPNLIAGCDFSSESAVCSLQYRALEHLEAAATDRTLIGRFIPWLVESYTEGRTSVDTANAAESLRVDVDSLNRIIGFVQYVAGLIRPRDSIASNAPGCTAFLIDDAILRFDGITTYEGLVKRLDEMRAGYANTATRPTPTAAEFERRSAPNPEPADVVLSSLHPGIGAQTIKLFADAHYKEAVRTAFSFFETTVQRLADRSDIGGKGLMAAVFASGPSVRPVLGINVGISATDTSEQEGLKFMAMGAMALIRNPFSHGSTVELNRNEAVEMLNVASFLFRQLDRVKSVRDQNG